MADMSRRRISTNNNGVPSDSRKRKYEQIASNGEADDGSTSCDYPCRYCSAVFVTQISLSRHVITFHEGEEPEQKPTFKFEGYDDEEEENGEDIEQEEEGENGYENQEVGENEYEEQTQEEAEETFEDSIAANNGYYETEEDGQGYVYDTEEGEGEGTGEVGDFDISQFMETSANEGSEMLGYSFLDNNKGHDSSSTSNHNSATSGAGRQMPSLPQQKNVKPKLSPEVLANVLAQVEELTSATTSEFVTCPLCRKTFGRKELSIHVSCEHGGAKFTCPYCARTISRRDHLKRHIQNVHPEMCSETEIGPFPRNLNLCRATNSQNKKASSPTPSNILNNSLSTQNQHQQLLLQQLQQHKQVKMETSNKTLPISIMTPRVQMHDEDDDEEDDFEGEEQTQVKTEQTNGYYSENNVQEDQDGEQEDSMQITVEPELPFQDLADYNENNDDEYSNSQDSNSFLHSLFQFDQNKAPTMSSVMERAQVTIDNMAYQCSLCSAVFSSKVLLDRHESTHSELRPHKCSICGKGFLRKEHLSKHLSSVHSGMKFTCEFCGKDISRKDHLIRHIRNVHPNQFYALPQDGSEELSAQLAHVQSVAIKTVQSLQPRPKKPYFNCDMCEATFINADDLHVHQSTVHADVRKYKCNYCAKAFKRKEHLTKHEVLHTGERKFTCRVCGGEFQRKEMLQDHIRRVHGINSNNVTVNGSNGSAISTIPCNLCDQLFQDRGMLLSHMTTAHNLIVNSPPGLPKNLQQNQHNHQTQVQQRTNGQSQSKTPTSSSTKAGNQNKAIPGLNGSNLGSLMDLINKGSITLSFHPIKQE